VSDVKRYANEVRVGADGPYDTIHENPNGSWVEFTDYDALSAKLAAAEARVARYEAAMAEISLPMFDNSPAETHSVTDSIDVPQETKL
jgi:hypothetical protein